VYIYIHMYYIYTYVFTYIHEKKKTWTAQKPHRHVVHLHVWKREWQGNEGGGRWKHRKDGREEEGQYVCVCVGMCMYTRVIE